MVRRFSWCTVAALVVLLFVTTEGLRERSTQVDDHKAHSVKDRGTLRYDSKSPEETTATPASSLSKPRSTRDRTSNFERHNGGTSSKHSINPEAKIESNKRSSFRTTRTTERNGVSTVTETASDARRISPANDTEEIKKVEPTINRRNGKRYSSETKDAAESKDKEQNLAFGAQKEVSRRTFNRKFDNSVAKRLDNKGPSVFVATTESSRSRTGRKIQTTYSTTELKTQLPTSRRFNNKKFEGVEATTAAFRRTEGRGRSTTERIDRGRSSRSKVNNRENNAVNRKGQDTLLSESESVRVDIPLAVESTENPTVDVTTSFSVSSQRQSSIDSGRRSDTKESSRANGRTGSERSKSRGRSSDSETASSISRSSSRRGSSKFNDYSTTEASEQTVSSRRNTVSRDRSRGSETKSSTNESRSRSRGRNFENGAKSTGTAERDFKRKSVGDRNSSDRRSRVLEAGTRATENRGQDQDIRGRSRSRSRVDATTPLAYSVVSDATTTTAPDTTVSSEIGTTSTETEITSTTIGPATVVSTTATPRTVATTATPSSTTTVASEGSGRSRGRGRGGSGQGRKQPKEDFFNHGLGFRGRKLSPEGSPNVGDSRKPTAPKNDSQYHGNPGWTLRRRPGYVNHSETLPKTIVPSPKDQTNEVIPPSEQLTSTEVITTIESSTATTRRSFKKQQTGTEESTTVAGTTTKSFRRGNKTFDKGRTFGAGKGSTEPQESDNYPPEFKARLSQLKNTNVKTPAPKTTSRTPLEVKKSTSALFAERSRMKLDLARRLVKPELNIEENDLDATTASSFSKPKPTGAPATDGTGKVAKLARPGAGERRGSVDSSQGDDRPSKLSRSGKSLGDASKVTGRPYSLKKGRVISERMVTSISVEEGAAVEETTKPYASTNPSVSTVSAEEGSATTVDTTRIRLSAGRGGKKLKEEEQASAPEHSDTITTFKPKKSYVFQSRGGKTHEQSATAEQSVTPTPKKSYTPTLSIKQNGAHRKSQASQEEGVIKKPKFGNGVTKPTFRPRYSKRTREKSVEDAEGYQQVVTTKVPPATSRYSRKKSVVKSADGKVKVATTEGPVTQPKKLEFRPRTSTYRRHSEVPTTLVQSTTKVDGARVAITPRSPKYHATLKTSTPSPRSVPQEPQVNLKIANDTTEQTSGITGGSNGDTGNTNIFNPTRSVFLNGSGTLLEQLRSTVAPLLGSLGNKTPVFSGAYSNVNNANSAPRITPSGSPPRFSARYKGAELFVRKQNNIYQPTVPSITSSSTTPVTPVENSGSAPPIDVSSPGEPRYLTLYHALESANVRNEQLQGNSSARRQEQVGVVPQVDFNATVANGVSDNPNNDTTSPTVATTSPQTPDTTTIQDSTLTPRLSEETETSAPMVATGAPENPSSTERASTSTEPPSTTEQVSSSTTEQASTSTESSSTTEQATTESLPRDTETTTVNPGGPVDIQLSSRINNSSNLAAETTTVSADQNPASSSEPSTIASTDVPVTTTQTLLSSTEMPTSSTTGATNINTSENPESNTIELSEGTSTQAADVSSTDASTTEAVSNNIIDAETTTMVPTSTVRNRLIDFAQDILSRLQASFSTTVPTTTSGQDSTTISPVTEMSNVVSDASMNNSLEALAQLKEAGTTTVRGELGTTTLSVATDQPGLRIAEEMTTQSAVGSVTTPLPTTATDQSNEMVSTQEAITQDDINSVTTTTSPPPTTTQDPRAASSTDQTTMSMVTSTNDTLLTELMSIAKTLLSEEINDTERLTPVQNSDTSSRLGNLVENEVDQQLSTTKAAESSSIPPDVTTESVESTPTTVAMPELTTSSVDPSQNEVDSVDLATTGLPTETSSDTPTTTPQSSVPDDEVDVAQTNRTTSLGPLAENVESTTPSFTTETGPQVAVSDRISSNSEPSLDTTTQTATQSSETTVTTAVNFELTTNTYDLMSPNLITTTETQTPAGRTTEVAGGSTETAVQLTNPTTVAPQPMMNTSTDQPEITTVSTVPETILSRVNTAANTPSASSELNVEQTTVVSTTDVAQNVETNPASESVTELAPLTTQTIGNETFETTTPTTTASLDVNSMDVTEAATNKSPLTSSTVPAMDITTNTPGVTANVPQTTPNPENETPTVVARFQDTTSATAQRTAGSGIGQTTEITTPMITDSSTAPSPDPSTTSPPRSSVITTTLSPVETTTRMTPTTATETTTSTSTGPPSDERTTSPPTATVSARMDVVTVTPMSETTVQMPVTTVDINENLVSTEAAADGTTTVSPERMGAGDGATNGTASSGTPGGSTAAAESTTMPTQTTPGLTMPTVMGSTSSPAQVPTTPYFGRFGGNRLTPAPRFSLSSTTKAPLRDYLIYGIYPNKTIVRKRPEDNLIDARNVNSPYVIFGIFPDGRLVRKFPNGTIIPDPPRSPVEVVFSLSTTTTTNRPPPRPYYNQANQGTYNQYQGPVYDNNRRPVAVPMRNVQSPGTVDLGLTGNAIVGPNGGGPDLTGPLGTPASVPSTNEMSNRPANAQMGTTSDVMSAIAGRPPTDSQGGRIVQDRERDEATRTKEAGGQRSSVYIGQDKFVNYWTDGAPTTNPRVVSVNINSVATAANEGPSPSVPSFENLLNSQPGGQVTAPPGFPWRDPLDQIFGITTPSPVITASVASNTLDDSGENSPAFARPVNPFVEVFTPFSSTIGNPRGNLAFSNQVATTTAAPMSTATATAASVTTAAPTTTTIVPTTTTTTMAPTTTTTTMAPTTTTTTMAPTTTTTTMAPTTTTTTMAPTTTTTTMAPTTTTTTMAPTTTTTTMAPTTTTTTTMAPTTTVTAPTTTSASVTTGAAANIVSQVTTAATSGATAVPLPSTTSFNVPKDLLVNMQQQNAFGTTFNDLAFLNSLLQSSSKSTTPKTLTQVEQLLANKILSLALNKPGPTRSPKAINFENASPNSIIPSSSKSPLEPIVIDLVPSSTAATPTWTPTVTQQTSEKLVSTTTAKSVESKTPTSTAAKTTLISTTKAPVVIAAKTTARPRTTTQAPLGFGASLWQALFGNGLFASTTQRPVKPKQVKTTPKSVSITPKPIQTTQKPGTTTETLRTVDVSKIQVNTPNSILKEAKSVTTASSVSTTKQQLLNNPNPRLSNAVTTTASPEEDAKFLIALLRAAQEDNTAVGSKKSSGLSQDDESFLRAILSGRALTTTTPAPSNDISDAALLAALLKAQGIEPPTPATDIREQLLLASLGQGIGTAPTASPATESTTITTRPVSTATRPTDTTKKTVTPRPTSRPRVRTTTWSPSSTYPPPLFSSFSNYGTPVQTTGGDNYGNGALFGATRAFSQFLGAALSGAAQQLQSLVRNGTRIVSEAVG